MQSQAASACSPSSPPFKRTVRVCAAAAAAAAFARMPRGGGEGHLRISVCEKWLGWAGCVLYYCNLVLFSVIVYVTLAF